MAESYNAVIRELEVKIEEMHDYMAAGSVPDKPSRDFIELAKRVATLNPVAEALPYFIADQQNKRYSQGHFEIALRDELGMDIRRWSGL